MAIRDILTYPDERLRQPCKPVTDFADPGFQTFVDDLVETMASGPGAVGIAAPQVGKMVQLLIMDCSVTRRPPKGHHGQVICVNPEILSWDGMETGREGCLSLPDYTGNVMRALDLSIQFQDRHGEERALSLTGFEARVMQHEMDHLEGRLFIDRLVSRKADLFKRKVYQKSRRG
ncbi:MAG: peptide deformylase [Magnetococcales bacterium]|nr:peptide deformylase [Magnetococcales bacterium]